MSFCVARRCGLQAHSRLEQIIEARQYIYPFSTPLHPAPRYCCHSISVKYFEWMICRLNSSSAGECHYLLTIIIIKNSHWRHGFVDASCGMLQNGCTYFKLIFAFFSLGTHFWHLFGRTHYTLHFYRWVWLSCGHWLLHGEYRVTNIWINNTNTAPKIEPPFLTFSLSFSFRWHRALMGIVQHLQRHYTSSLNNLYRFVGPGSAVVSSGMGNHKNHKSQKGCAVYGFGANSRRYFAHGKWHMVWCSGASAFFYEYRDRVAARRHR